MVSEKLFPQKRSQVSREDFRGTIWAGIHKPDRVKPSRNELTLKFRLVRMEDEGFKLQPSGKIFNGEIYKPTTTIPIFIKMNKVSGEIRTPNVIQRNNIEFLVQVSSPVHLNFEK